MTLTLNVLNVSVTATDVMSLLLPEVLLPELVILHFLSQGNSLLLLFRPLSPYEHLVTSLLHDYFFFFSRNIYHLSVHLGWLFSRFVAAYASAVRLLLHGLGLDHLRNLDL